MNMHVDVMGMEVVISDAAYSAVGLPVSIDAVPAVWYSINEMKY
jgi:hypothetical protein